MRGGYIVYMVVLTVFTLPILLAPQITMWSYSAGQALQDLYGYTCHQFDSRSICFFPGEGSYGDCTEGDEVVGNSGTPLVIKGGIRGYKLPVCSRDTAIYVAALVGGAVLYFQKKTDEMMTPHPIYFLIALIPIGLDGGTQLLGWRESTNLIRMITGAIAGFAFPYYCVPILNKIFSNK